MQLHDVQPKTKRVSSKRVGRGGKRGKTSGKGTKGQKSRAGAKMRPEIRDIIKKIPKLRGHGKNRSKSVNDARIKPVVVNIAQLEEVFKSGEAVNPTVLLERKLVSAKRSSTPRIKILGTGQLTKKLAVSGVLVSESAKRAIINAGGVVE